MFFCFLVPTICTLANEDWTRWGGPNGDFVVTAPDLADEWPPEGPQVLWQRPLGAGYSAILAEGGTLYTLYRESEADVVIALDARDGAERWTFRYATSIREGQRPSFGRGPNAPPHLIGDRLYTMSFDSSLHCFEKHSGRLIWKHNLIDELEGKAHISGNSNAMVTHKGMLIVMLGGNRHAMVGFDPATGKLLWQSEQAEISYGAPTLIHVDGEPQWVFLSVREVIGIGAESGKIRWRHPQVNQHDTHAARPSFGEDGLLFVPSQRDGGSLTLRLQRQGEQIAVEEVMHTRQFNILHGNVIRQGEVVYGSNGDMLTALNIRTGQVLWRERGYPVAQMIKVNDRFLILDETGKLSMARIDEAGFQLMAEKVLLKPKSWTVPTLVGTHLYLRDTEKLLALELGPRKP
ncbi:MAG: PQQ-like beta-propeller repeat protein [Acidobacteria bacterium]|nr:PQQ-like beta-propeller repeat protein [Acidobacteriota bacterium]